MKINFNKCELVPLNIYDDQSRMQSIYNISHVFRNIIALKNIFVDHLNFLIENKRINYKDGKKIAFIGVE
jgi:hypothetical protein